MKNKIIIFLILFTFFAPIVSHAYFAPLANLTIVANLQSKEKSVNFNLQHWGYIEKYDESKDTCKDCLGDDENCFQTCSDGYISYYDWDNYDKFLLQTENLPASRIITVVADDKYKLSQDNISGLKIKNIFCSSDNPNDLFWYEKDSVSFNPIQYENITCTFNSVKTKTPVLIVPGLVGTELKNSSELLWPDLGRMATDFGDEFLDGLQFSKSLAPIDINIIIGSILGSPAVTHHFYDLLINEFEGEGYLEGDDLFTFPYDWRFGVSGKFSDGKTNADLLGQKIEDIMAQTGSDKVDVVAHSMGGLITKKYVMDKQADNHIGKAIFVGVPNTGAPKAVKVLLQGDNFGIPWLADSEIKKIAENMPASYDLLPSQKYYDSKGSFIKTINEDVGELQYLEKNLNYEEAKSFLTDGHALNSLALSNAENLHTQDFDNYDLRTAGVDVYSINGCRSGTLAKIVERKSKNIFGQEDTNYDLQYGSLPLTPGDGTVPLESATNLPIDENNKYYALVADHGKMPSANGIRQKIVNLITGSSLSTGDNLITQDIGQCQLNGKAISIFSPVNIFVTDQDANRLGLAEDESIINEIPNAMFEILGEHKFIYLPQDNGQVYTIKLQGTGAGTFTIKSQDIRGSQPEKTEIFSNLPVTIEMTGQIDISPTDNLTTLSLSNSPDLILPSSTVDGPAVEDLQSPASVAVLSGIKEETGIYNSEVDVEIKAIDELSGVLSVEYNLDDVGYQKIPGDVANLKVLTEGKHTLKFFSTDKAGNNEQEKKIEFEIKFLEVVKPLPGTGGGGGGIGSQITNQVNIAEDKKLLTNQEEILEPVVNNIVENSDIEKPKQADDTKKIVLGDETLKNEQEEMIQDNSNQSIATASISSNPSFFDHVKNFFNWIIQMVYKLFS
jgi:pimeloyl-ACP methyl ester carboxylesterase